MMYYTCEYAGFICGIRVDQNNCSLVERFRKEFSDYYKIVETTNIDSCFAKVLIVEDAYVGKIETGKEVCIHSSHSTNIKYLLDGSTYTKQDADIFAKTIKQGNSLKYYISKTKSKVLANLKEKEIYLSGENLYNMLVYIYESLLCIHIEHRGGIQIHAACCLWNNNGYVITGKSGSGKTTLLFDIIKRGGEFHSNDRVAIIEENGDLIAYSIPIPVNVSINTMYTMPSWKDNEIIRQAEANTKIRFTVPELSKLFKRKTTSGVKIDQIIVVDFRDGDSNIQEIKSKKLSKYLEILSPYDENHPKWLPLFSYPNTAQVEKKLERWKDKVSIYRVSGRSPIHSFIEINNS